ncbi:MAG: hypothetical protein HZRFUVUK_001022 [Candidatus Fervidibacterota bacterium]
MRLNPLERVVYLVIIAVLVVVIIVQWWTRLPYAVMVKGDVVGWVGSKRAFKYAMKLALEEAERIHKGAPVCFLEAETGDVFCERHITRGKVQTLTPKELSAILLKRLTIGYKAVAIVANGKPIVALSDEEKAKNVLKRIQLHYAQFASYAGELIKEASFKEEVEIKRMHIPIAIYAHDEEEAVRRILEGGEKAVYHKVKKGEVAIVIGRKYGVSLAELQKLNSGRDLNKLKIGDVLLIKPGKPLLTVITYHQRRVKEKIPFKEERKFAPHLPGGEIIVQRRGKEGVKEVTYEVMCENGVEVSKKVLSERVLSEPVNQVILVGGGIRDAQ